MTWTAGLKRRAVFAVSSVHPLQTTVTPISPGLELPSNVVNVRAMTELSLCAGMTIEIIATWTGTVSIWVWRRVNSIRYEFFRPLTKLVVNRYGEFNTERQQLFLARQDR